MSIGQIARKELADTGQSLALWGVTIAVVLFTGGTVTLIGFLSDESPRRMVTMAVQLSSVIFPIIALFAAKGSITAERESGSLRTLLALPPSRLDVVIGKYLGRVALVTLATAAGIVATVLGLVATGNPVGGVLISTFAVTVLGLTVSFAAIGVGLSAAVSSDGRATGVAVAVYLLLVILWGAIMQGVLMAAQYLGLASAGEVPWWARVLRAIAPNEAATAVFSAVLSGNTFAANPIQSAWLPAIIILAWAVLPVAAGYWRFRDADLG